jgi:hypothetical protein
MDYKNGKIYRLVLDDTNEEYIGSTTQPLSKRFSSHKTNFSRMRNGDKKVSYYSCFHLFEKGTPQIFLIEDFPCESKRHLEKREREILEQRRRDGIVCVNKSLPSRSDAEYKADNREKILDDCKAYYQKNREKIQLKQKQRRDCDICGKNVNIQHISRHKKSKKCQNFRK